MSTQDTKSALPDGVVTPLVTLLDTEGRIDADAMRVLVDAQVASGIDGVLSGGSTGELGTLSAAERLRGTEIIVGAASGRIPVWAGAGGLSTADTVTEAQGMVDRGADAILALSPLYFAHSDDELYRHFAVLRESVSVPLVAYDVPRAPQKLGSGLLARLAADGVINAVKDSSGNMTDARLLRAAAPRGSGFKTYAGAEITIEACVANGFEGIVPGFANFCPTVFAEQWRAIMAGDTARAEELSTWVATTFPILGAPWPGAGGLAQAIGALKEATAWALDLPAAQPLGVPLTAPPAVFRERVVEILEDAMRLGTVEHVALR